MEQSNLENSKYWETLPREMIEGIIKGNIRTLDRKMTEMTEIFCSAGYYLKRQQNEEQWKETGASNFAEYVKATYGKSRGWATRMIQINERYSIGGNDPRLDAKYQNFSVSQLQEMLYLTEDEAAGVTPDMTVRQIRQQRPSPEPVQDEQYFAQDEQKTAQCAQNTAQDEQNVSQGQQDGQERQQPEENATITAGFDVSGYDDEEAREWAEIVEEVEAEIAAEEAEDAIDNDLKREITRNEWVRMYDVMERWLPEEITPQSLKAAINNHGCVRDDFWLDCRYYGVTINKSKWETWATAARNLNAIRTARKTQEADEAAAAARPGYIDYAEEWQPETDEIQTAETGEGQQAEVVDLADFCDVATDPEPEPEEEPAAAAEEITIDLTDLADPEDMPKVVREPVMADWSQRMEMPEGAAAGTYTRSDVYMFELEARRDLEQLRECNRLSAEEGGPQLPERTMKKHIMLADAAKLLLQMMDMIYASQNQEDDE